MQKCFVKKVGWALSWSLVAAFVICMLWVFTNSEAEIRQLHINLLKVAFLWFRGMDFWSWVSGLIQSFAWGWIIAAIFVPIWNAAHSKEEAKK